MRRLVIDASAVVDGRPLALEAVYYPSLVGAYARALRGVKPKPVVVVPATARAEVEENLAREGVAGDVEITDVRPSDSTDLSLDLRHVHYPRALRGAVCRADVSLPEPAWIIETGGDISRAATTLERHDMYVLARLLVIPVARRLALALKPTPISPNAVTGVSCLLGVAGAALPLLPGYSWRILAALLIHLSITLDFTDGYLARLRGTESPFGYWFDTLLDEVVKFSLFLGLTALVLRDGPAWAVAPAVIVLLLYHVLACNHWLTRSLERGDITRAVAGPTPRRRAGLAGVAHRVFDRLTFLDVQVYAAAFAFLAHLEAAALVVYAVNYLARFVRLLQVRLATRSLA